MTAWDDVLVDGVDTIDASRWNTLISHLSDKSDTSHAHTEFQILPNSEHWYVYKADSTYYAKNLGTGTVDYSGADFSTVMTSVIGAITNAGSIEIGRGTFTVSTPIVVGDKSIIIEGSGWGKTTDPTANPGTLLYASFDSLSPVIMFGTVDAVTRGAGIQNMMIKRDPTKNLYNAVHLWNTRNSFVEKCYFTGFDYGGLSSSIIINGKEDGTLGGKNNRCSYNSINAFNIGITIGKGASYCLIEGNELKSAGTGVAIGIYCDGTGGTSPTVGCVFTGNTVTNNVYAGSIGLYINAGANNSGYHNIIGNHLSDSPVSLKIDNGTGIGGNAITGNALAGSTVDNGNVTSIYTGNS